MMITDWIKASETLPELIHGGVRSLDVLCWADYDVIVGKYTVLMGVPEWRSVETNSLFHPTHWMPIVGPDEVSDA